LNHKLDSTNANSRCKGSDTNTSTDEQHGLKVQEIFTSAAERAIDHDTGQSAVQRWIGVGPDDLSTSRRFALSALVTLLREVAANCFSESSCEITSDTDVDRDIILLRGTLEDYLLSEDFQRRDGYDIPGQRERVPLEVRNLGARKEDVLTSPGCSLLLLDLNLHNVGRVLDNLRDVCIMTRANFAEDTLRNPNNTANKPIALYTYQQHLSYRRWEKHTQNTPIVLDEQ
jgi:hypothetical protein